MSVGSAGVGDAVSEIARPRVASKTFGPEREPEMNRNLLYIVIGLLIVGVAVLGYVYYEESRSGVDIRIDGEGLSIEGN